jgi:hypothetical protein
MPDKTFLPNNAATLGAASDREHMSQTQAVSGNRYALRQAQSQLFWCNLPRCYSHLAQLRTRPSFYVQMLRPSVGKSSVTGGRELRTVHQQFPLQFLLPLPLVRHHLLLYEYKLDQKRLGRFQCNW